MSYYFAHIIIIDQAIFLIVIVLISYSLFSSGNTSCKLSFSTSKILQVVLSNIFFLFHYLIGCIGPAIFLVITGYVPCDMPYSAVATLTIAVGFCGFQYPGVFVNHVDIATPFAGILFGMSNTFGSLSGIIAPYTVQMITASVSITERVCS